MSRHYASQPSTFVLTSSAPSEPRREARILPSAARTEKPCASLINDLPRGGRKVDFVLMKRRALAVLAVTLAALSPAPAATAYTNLASFLGALTNSYTESFSGLTNTSSTNTAAPQNFSGNGLTFSANTQPTNSLWTVVNGGTKWLSVDPGSSSLVFTLTSGNITAVGGNFFLTDLPGDFITGTINILFSDTTTTNWSPSSTSAFIGFTFDSPVTSMTISRTGNTDFVTAGTITVGQVPEPTTTALLLVAGGSLLWWSRRRKR